MAKKKLNVDGQVFQVEASLESSLVPIETLQTHPKNPRVGDVELIKQSLVANKQYRPIVVRKSDNVILAGNHTYKAAKELGWSHIAADIIDADEDESLRILIADNRTSDVGKMDNRRLVSFLQSLPKLEGTGYTDEFVRRQLHALDSNLLFKEALAVNSKGHRGGTNRDKKAQWKVGQVLFAIDAEPFTAWLSDNPDPEKVAEKIGWPTSKISTEPTKPTAKVEVTASDQITRVKGELVDVAKLKPIENSARQSDVDRIAESLAVNGQYRRVVVNKRTNRVPVNWGVVQAAKKLGWKQIAAVLIDVDEETEKRIHAVDNRAAQMAHYHEKSLCELLSELSSMAGTGYTPQEMQQLFEDAGAIDGMQQEMPQVHFVVRFKPTKTNWRIAATWKDHSAWYAQLIREARYSDSGITKVLAHRLGFDESQFVDRKY